MWTPPARYVNREGKRLACEKHMDWWPASTKPLLQPYAIQNCSTIALTKVRLHISLAARFLTRDVAQIVEPRFSSEVEGSMPRISDFSEEPGKQKKGKTVSCFVRPEEDMDLYVQNGKRSIWKSTELAEKAIGVPNHQGLPQKDVGGNITILMSESKTSVWHNSSFGPHQRGMSIGRASDWHVRNTWIDDQHRQSQFYNHMQYKTVQPLHWQKKGFICH